MLRLSRARSLVILCIVSALLTAITMNILNLGVEVSVINVGTRSISNVTIDYNGGSSRYFEMATGIFFSDTIHLVGESALCVRFVDSTGRTREAYIDTYLEKGYTGRVSIKVDDLRDIRWTEDIKLHFLGTDNVHYEGVSTISAIGGSQRDRCETVIRAARIL